MDQFDIFFPWLLESSKPHDPPIIASLCAFMAYILTLNPGSLPQVSNFVFVFLVFLVDVIFSYFMYYKLPYIFGIDPSINLNLQIQNMAVFQRMILLYSNHVDSFTLPQTLMLLHRKWTRHHDTGDTSINKTALTLALMSSQEKTQHKLQII